jgi:hypothetical protein
LSATLTYAAAPGEAVRIDWRFGDGFDIWTGSYHTILF